MTLLIVRHAHAGERRTWNGTDRARPLTDRGHKQAEAVARALAAYTPKRIYSSPTVRCRQTVEPLGDSLGVEVEDDDRLFEGARRDAIDSLIEDVSRKRTIVLSSHGDVVPALLEGLLRRGMTHDDRLVWPKASTWVVEYSTKQGWGAATYLKPPARR